MRHTSEILKELGFNEDAPESTKRAFLKHLQQSMHTEKSTSPRHETVAQPEQLSFEFSYQTNDVERDPKDPSEQLELVLFPFKPNVKPE